MHVDLTRPDKLYRYSEDRWLARALQHGEFRLRPAADYFLVESVGARHDNELVRIDTSPASQVKVFMAGSTEPVTPLGDVTYTSTVGTNYLLLCFSSRWDEQLFDDFMPSDSCLIIHEVHEFAERIHAAAQEQLPGWVGMDASVMYGCTSPLGAVFSKNPRFIVQHEWRFAWRPPTRCEQLAPLLVSIGNIERIAEVVNRPISVRL